jgi:hypothetical protein
MPIVGNDESHHDTWNIPPRSMLLRLSDHPNVLACGGSGSQGEPCNTHISRDRPSIPGAACDKVSFVVLVYWTSVLVFLFFLVAIFSLDVVKTPSLTHHSAMSSASAVWPVNPLTPS